jgi:hypothetical protein
LETANSQGLDTSTASLAQAEGVANLAAAAERGGIEGINDATALAGTPQGIASGAIAIGDAIGDIINGIISGNTGNNDLGGTGGNDALGITGAPGSEPTGPDAGSNLVQSLSRIRPQALVSPRIGVPDPIPTSPNFFREVIG